MTMSCK